MRQPGGARVIEEQELRVVRQRVAGFPEEMRRKLSQPSGVTTEDVLPAAASNGRPS
jgi:hypothetical protein